MTTRKPKPPIARRLVAWVGRTLVSAGLLGAVWLGGQWLWQQLQRPEVMPLTRVGVDGDIAHLHRDQLETVVGLAVTGNYFTVDIGKVHEAAVSLPWVQRASVRRIWPDTLMIRVEEREAFARWGESALVSRRGEVFRPESLEGMQQLPLLEAPDDTRGRQMIDQFNAWQMKFKATGHGLIRLRLDGRGGWCLWLDNGLEIALGKEDVEARLDRVFRIMGRMPGDLEKMQRIDARYANGMAVKWKPEQTETLAAGVVTG